MPYALELKALHLLRQNVRALLVTRKESEALLAKCLGFKHRSSLNKFLNSERAGFQMWRLDKLAAFFGLPVYQLFQPGISPLLDRRVDPDRRSGKDRRIGHSQRVMLTLAAELDAHRPPRKGAHVAVVTPSPKMAALNRLTEDYERRVSALLADAESGGQAAPPRKAVPPARARGRTPRGSDAPEP